MFHKWLMWPLNIYMPVIIIKHNICIVINYLPPTFLSEGFCCNILIQCCITQWPPSPDPSVLCQTSYCISVFMSWHLSCQGLFYLPLTSHSWHALIDTWTSVTWHHLDNFSTVKCLNKSLKKSYKTSWLGAVKKTWLDKKRYIKRK